jgi:hypothetical protein
MWVVSRGIVRGRLVGVASSWCGSSRTQICRWFELVLFRSRDRGALCGLSLRSRAFVAGSELWLGLNDGVVRVVASFNASLPGRLPILSDAFEATLCRLLWLCRRWLSARDRRAFQIRVQGELCCVFVDCASAPVCSR